MKQRIVIFGNGKLSKQFLRLLKPNDYVIGVDRAAFWLLEHTIVPALAIGDFDSASEKELKIIKKSSKKVKQFAKDKNWTDMELAVREAIRLHPSEIVLLGGTGTRLDHTMATWQAMDILLTAKIPHILIDETNRVRLVGIGRTILKRRAHRYISILPFTAFVTVRLEGFRYNLPTIKLVRGTTRGVSNEIIGRQATITIYSGKAWVIESND